MGFALRQDLQEERIKSMRIIAEEKIGKTKIIIRDGCRMPSWYEFVYHAIIDAAKYAVRKTKGVYAFPEIEFIMENNFNYSKDKAVFEKEFDQKIQEQETTGHFMASVSSAEYLKGPARVHIYVEPLIAVSYDYVKTKYGKPNYTLHDVWEKLINKLDKQVQSNTKGALKHELTHLLSFKVQSLAETTAKLKTRLKELTGQYASEYIEPFPDYGLEGFRYMLFKFITNIILEGIGAYCEEPRKFDEKQWGYDYAIAIRKAEECKENWNRIVAAIGLGAKWYPDLWGEVQDKLLESSYSIGYHVASTIAYGLKTDAALVRLLDIKKRAEYIKTYEDIMTNQLHKPPVISYNSGKGIFDYDKALKTIWNATDWEMTYKKMKAKAAKK